MSIGRKYANLPDVDIAPDIYETPELTDDASTLPTSSTLRSDSRASSIVGTDEDETAIDRHRIDPTQARNSFLPSHDNEGKDQGWVGSKRDTYRKSARRLQNGDLSDEDDEESLDRKLTRLQREVAEVKEASQKQESRPHGPKQSANAHLLDSLNQVLNSIERPKDPTRNNPTTRINQQLNKPFPSDQAQNIITSAGTIDSLDQPSYNVNQASSHEQGTTLSRISDFDKRLRLLETALGMDSIPLPTQERGAARAVLPILDTLDQQISSLSLEESSLDKIGRQVRQMTDDAEKLAEARKKAAAQISSNKSGSELGRTPITKTGSHTIDPTDSLDQTSKINALYGTLPTIESLAPLLPSVLDRLRSLRAVHADAALASETLARAESRQAAMAEELKEWKDGLEKVESAIRQGEVSLKQNMGVVDTWVKELESRLQMTNETPNR
ncbi:MAG: hypothetical protein Q9220_001338 [cf. Caloplaca sp. 1 TL-2023]